MTYLPSLNIKQIVEIVVGILVTISALVEWNKKLPFQPISSFFRWLGSNLMKSTIEDINTKFAEVNIKFDELEKAHEEKSIELEKQQKANNDAIIELSKKMDDKFSEHLKEADEKEAKRLRARIISFSDSCRVHTKHTKNHFENVFRDYDDYLAYCKRHNFANHYIEGEYEYIRSVYQKCLLEDDFL